MKTLTLKIEDSAVEKVMRFLEQLKDVVTVEPNDLKNDPLAQELQKRIKEIDDESIELVSHSEVMSRVYAKWEQKCL